MTFGREEPLVQVVGPADGWILERLGQRLATKLPYAVFSINQPDRGIGEGIAYYMNYALFQGPTSFIDVGFFTHLEGSHDFLGRARDMDWCVCMSRKYADWLREQGIEHVTHIPMGFDYYRYRARLVLGVIGRLDHPRKGTRNITQRREARREDGEAPILVEALRALRLGVSIVLIFHFNGQASKTNYAAARPVTSRRQET